MMPTRRSPRARFLAQALAVVLTLAGLESCTEAKGVSDTGPSRGLHAGARSGRIEQVRLGFALDPEGTVSSGCTARTFALRDPIHFSLRITGAPPGGGVVRVEVRDTVTRRLAWSEDRPVPSGASNATFAIGRDLPEGVYRAEPAIDGEIASARDFRVRDRAKLSN